MPPCDARIRAEDEEAVSPHRDLNLQAVLDALEAFVAADSWAEARRVLETHCRELLTDVADDVLVTLMARYKDAAVVRMLAQHRQVLQRCRVVGIDVAFTELSAVDIPCPVGIDPDLWRRALQIDNSAAMMDFLAEYPDLIASIYRRMSFILNEAHVSLLDGLLALLEADTWTAARIIVESLPALLSLEADLWLMQYGAALSRAGNQRAVAVVIMRRWLLTRCRMIGVTAVFGEHLTLWDGAQFGKSHIPTPYWVKQDVAQAL